MKNIVEYMKNIVEFIVAIGLVAIVMFIGGVLLVIYWGVLPVWLSITIFLIIFCVAGYQWQANSFKNKILQPKGEDNLDYLESFSVDEAIEEFKNKNKKNNDLLNYEGEVKNGVKHGQGTMTYSDGSKYEGKWKNNLQHGQGTMTYSDGSKYEGKWKNNLQHGQGTTTYYDGSIKYVGMFEDGEYHGQGTFSWGVKQPEYKGDFRNGQKTIGIMTYANGETYLEEFKDGYAFKRTKCDKNGKIIKKKEKKGKK